MTTPIDASPKVTNPFFNNEQMKHLLFNPKIKETTAFRYPLFSPINPQIIKNTQFSSLDMKTWKNDKKFCIPTFGASFENFNQ